MVEEATGQPVVPPWAEPSALLQFLEAQRASGFKIDPRHHIAVRDLVLALVATGTPFQDRERFARLLGPIVCSTPQEQEAFPRDFLAWAGQSNSPQSAALATASPDIVGTVRAAWRGWRWIVLAILALGLAVAIVYFARTRNRSATPLTVTVQPDQPAPVVPLTAPAKPEPVAAPPPSRPTGSWKGYLAIAGGVVLLGGLCWWLWWRYRAKLFLEQRATAPPPELDDLTVSASAEAFIDRGVISRVASELRRRAPGTTRELDAAATVERTIDAGGWPLAVYATHRVTPEYVLLVDRLARGDHQARLADSLYQQLRLSHVPVTRYFYDGDPRLLHTGSSASSVTLDEVAERHRRHRLLLFTDGSSLVHPSTGQFHDWLAALLRWPERALLTPEPRRFWNTFEQSLSRHFVVLPATPRGAAGLAHDLRDAHGSAHDFEAETLPGVPLPRVLRAWPERWIERHEPAPQAIADMIEGLRLHLDEDGLAWLCALAVYPAIEWHLTLYLGNVLRDGSGRPLLSWNRLTALSRLPWLRFGSMPDWLRMRLIALLPRDREKSIRTALDGLLASVVDPSRGVPFKLEIAKAPPRGLRAFARAIRARRARAEPDGPMRDYVFKTFMSGHKLAFRVPELLRRYLLGERPRSVPPVSRGRIFAAAAVAAAVAGSVFEWAAGEFAAFGTNRLVGSFFVGFPVALLTTAFRGPRIQAMAPGVAIAGAIALIPPISHLIHGKAGFVPAAFAAGFGSCAGLSAILRVFDRDRARWLALLVVAFVFGHLVTEKVEVVVGIAVHTEVVATIWTVILTAPLLWLRGARYPWRGWSADARAAERTLDRSSRVTLFLLTSLGVGVGMASTYYAIELARGASLAWSGLFILLGLTASAFAPARPGPLLLACAVSAATMRIPVNVDVARTLAFCAGLSIPLLLAQVTRLFSRPELGVLASVLCGGITMLPAIAWPRASDTIGAAVLLLLAARQFPRVALWPVWRRPLADGRARLALATAAILVSVLIPTISVYQVYRRMVETRQQAELAVARRLTLGPQLENALNQLTRTLQDAAAKKDAGQLALTKALLDTLRRALLSTESGLDPRLGREAALAIEGYYESARELVQRMMAGETGEAVVDSMTVMQVRQSQASSALKAAIRPDPSQVEKRNLEFISDSFRRFVSADRPPSEDVRRLELEPRLESDLARLSRAFQEAAAAQDPALLDQAEVAHENFRERLRSAGSALDSQLASQAATAVNDYYLAARSVVRRMIAGETGEALVEAMAVMQVKQNQAASALRAATRLRVGSPSPEAPANDDTFPTDSH